MSEDNNPNRSTLPTGASRVAALLARRANTATSLFAEITARRIEYEPSNKDSSPIPPNPPSLPANANRDTLAALCINTIISCLKNETSLTSDSSSSSSSSSSSVPLDPFRLHFTKVSLPVALKGDVLQKMITWRALTDVAMNALLDEAFIALDLRLCFNITDKSLFLIAERCPQLRALNLRECRGCTPAGVKHIIENCPNLEALDLSLWKEQLNDGAIQVIFQNYKPKEGGGLRLFGIRGSAVTSAGLNFIGSTLGPTLEVLDLRWMKTTVNAGSIAPVLRACPKLHSIDVGWCTIGGNDSLVDTISLLCEGRLQQLDLEMCMDVTDEAISLLAKRCPDLRFLRLKNCKRVSDAALFDLAKNCPKLVALNISGCVEITDQGIQAMARHCGELQALSLMNQFFGAGALEALLNHCPKLKLLDLGTLSPTSTPTPTPPSTSTSTSTSSSTSTSTSTGGDESTGTTNQRDPFGKIIQMFREKGVHVVTPTQTRVAPVFGLYCDFNDIDFAAEPSIAL